MADIRIAGPTNQVTAARYLCQKQAETRIHFALPDQLTSQQDVDKGHFNC
jgi:hypothetical protein